MALLSLEKKVDSLSLFIFAPSPSLWWWSISSLFVEVICSGGLGRGGGGGRGWHGEGYGKDLLLHHIIFLTSFLTNTHPSLLLFLFNPDLHLTTTTTDTGSKIQEKKKRI